jgi:hypothetical protein
MESIRSRWAGRFVGMTFALGGLAWVIFGLLVLGNVLSGTGNYVLGPASSRIVAGGGAGSWFTMGILAFLLVGIGAVGFTAFFYQYIEGTLGLALTGWRNVGAWVHLFVGGLAAVVASLLMAWGGFQAGAALLGTDIGGGGQNVGYVHTNILNPIALPIAIFMGIALLGYLVGGIVLATAWMAARKK